MMQKFSQAVKRNLMGKNNEIQSNIKYSLGANYAVFHQETIWWSQGLGQNFH